MLWQNKTRYNYLLYYNIHLAANSALEKEKWAKFASISNSLALDCSQIVKTTLLGLPMA